MQQGFIPRLTEWMYGYVCHVYGRCDLERGKIGKRKVKILLFIYDIIHKKIQKNLQTIRICVLHEVTEYK